MTIRRIASLRTVATSTVVAGALIVPAGAAMAASPAQASAKPAASASASSQHGKQGGTAKKQKLPHGFSAHVSKGKGGHQAKIKYGNVTLNKLNSKHRTMNKNGLIITLHKNGKVTTKHQKPGPRG